jgi:hypothetical protein
MATFSLSLSLSVSVRLPLSMPLVVLMIEQETTIYVSNKGGWNVSGWECRGTIYFDKHVPESFF